jgi:hypothetical protein
MSMRHTMQNFPKLASDSLSSPFWILSKFYLLKFLLLLSALYLWSQNQKLPTTPGILWERQGNNFVKNIMTTGNSFTALQWLLFAQENGKIL